MQFGEVTRALGPSPLRRPPSSAHQLVLEKERAVLTVTDGYCVYTSRYQKAQGKEPPSSTSPQ